MAHEQDRALILYYLGIKSRETSSKFVAVFDADYIYQVVLQLIRAGERDSEPYLLHSGQRQILRDT